MSKILKENKVLFSFFGFVLLCCACFTITSSIVPRVSANETRNNVDFSLAKVSEAAALYLNTMTSPSYAGCDEIESITAGNAGGLVGAFDTDAYDKAYGVAERESANVLVYSYDRLAHVRIAPGESNATTKSLAGYGYYGYMLAQIGLDESTVGDSSSGLRLIIGVLFMAAYILSIGMTMFFNLVIAFMQSINPFGMFAKAAMETTAAARGSGGGWVPEFADQGGISGFAGALNKFTENVASLYSVVYGMSFYFLIPLFVACAVFVWLVIYKGQRFGQIFKPLIVRILFVFIGVPFMFSIYDVVLTAARGTLTASAVPATQVVGSLFCDFQNWIYSSENGEDNLSLPTGYTYSCSNETFTISGTTAGSARQICYAVNQQTSPTFFTADVPGTTGGGIMNYSTYDTEIIEGMEVPRYTVEENGSEQPGLNPGDVIEDANSISGIMDILTRYATGEVVSSANYASAVAKHLADEDIKGALIMFSTSSTWQNYDNEQTEAFEYDGNDGGSAGNTGGKNTIQVDPYSPEEVGEFASARWNGCDEYGAAGQIFCNGHLMLGGGGGQAGYSGRSDYTFDGGTGISTLSMYNYLNSRFTSSGVHVSSPTSSSNDQVKYQHYAVSPVGTGIMRFIYLADGLCLLAAMSVIGYGYALAMMIGNFRALFQMIPKVFVGMLGSMRGIAGALALTFALVAEVGITVCLFDIAMTLLFSIYTMVEAPLAQLFSTHLGELNAATGGTLVTALLGILSISVILFTIKKLLEWRHAVVGATTNVATELINKIVGTQVATPDIDMPTGSVASKALTAAGLVYGAATYAGGSGLVNNNSDGSVLADVKNKMTNAFTGNSSDRMRSALGVKRGNGTGQVSGELDLKDQSRKSVPDDKLDYSDRMNYSDRMDRAIKREEAAKSGLEVDDRDGKGEGFANIVTEDFVDQNVDDFEKQMGETAEDQGNPLEGEAPTDKTLKDYANDGMPAPEAPNGTYTWKDRDGNTNTIKKSVDEEGNTVVEQDINKADGSWSTSKLVDNDNTSTLETKSGGKGTNPDDPDELSVVVEDKDTHDKTVHKEVKENGATTFIDEEYTTDDAGNKVVTSKSSNKKTGTIDMTTITDRKGNQTITKTVTDKNGKVTSSTSQVRVLSGGGTSTNTETIMPNGFKSNASSTTNGSGLVINSSETVTSDQGVQIKHTVTNTKKTDIGLTTTTETTEGGVTTHVKERSYNADSTGQYQNKTVQSYTTNANNVPTPIKVDQYTYNNQTQEYVITNHAVNNTSANVSAQTDTKNIGGGSSSFGSASVSNVPYGNPPKAPNGRSIDSRRNT